MLRVRTARGPALVGLTVLLCLAGLLAACTVGPSVRPPVVVRGENVPAPPPAGATPAPRRPAVPPLQAQNGSIPFADCTADAFAALGVAVPADRELRVECGELAVAGDPARPDAGRAVLGVVRVGVAGGLDRPPLLALGDSVTGPTAAHAVALATQVSPAVLDTFTLIGLDRRGAGSDRLDCAPADARAALVDADPAAVAEPELAALLEQARAVVQGCNLQPRSPTSFRSDAGVIDVDALRVRLGVAQLSAIGVGDGAAALARWATVVPTNVGRLVLDGPPDLAATEPGHTTARATAADAAFDAFADACAGGCTLGPDPRTTVTALVDALRVQPLVAANGRRLTAGATVTAVLGALSEPRDWTALGAALAAATAGDPVPLLDRLDPTVGPGAGFDAALATACNDNPARFSPPEVGELATRLRTEHPLVGGTLALGLLACAPWPASGPAETSAAPVGLPPVLVIGTAADPRAPQDESRAVADALAGSSFLDWQGSGSGAYPRTPCVAAAVDGLLVDAVAPTTGTLCPP